MDKITDAMLGGAKRDPHPVECERVEDANAGAVLKPASEVAAELARKIGNWLDVKITEPQGMATLTGWLEVYGDTHAAQAKLEGYIMGLERAAEEIDIYEVIFNVSGVVAHLRALKAEAIAKGEI